MGAYEALAPATAAVDLTPAEVLARYEAGMALVNEARQRRAEQEARERQGRSRELDAQALRYEIWSRGAFAKKRAEERMQLQEEHIARCQAIDRAEDAELRELAAEFKRKAAAIHARHNERRQENGRKSEQESASLLTRQQAEFNPAAELIAGWEAARRRVIADLQRDGGSRQRLNEGLAEWEEFHPKPTGHGLGR